MVEGGCYGQGGIWCIAAVIRLQQIIHHCTFLRFLERGRNVDWIGDFMDRIMLSKPEILRLLWDITVFRLISVFVDYDLFNTTTFVQNCIYI